MVRFDKPCLRVKGAVDYFREHFGIGDYLDLGGRAEMTWFGAGAERLGLRGKCDEQAFENLCRRAHPITGDKLTVRERGASGRVCYFGQISPPKDVSLVCLVGGDDRIRMWWDEAVQETLTEIEAVTSTRVRRAGADRSRVTGNMVAAVVTHEASRALDPQLHTHVAIMNVTFDTEESRWKSVQPEGFYRYQAFFREVCYNRLAEKLRNGGYEVEPARTLGFTLRGVPPELRERFSRRRTEILRKATADGAATQDALQAIASASRDAKANASPAELRAAWQRAAGSEAGALADVVASATNRQVAAATREASVPLASAGEHLFERQSVVDERDLLREALIAGRGLTSPADLRAELAARLESGELLRAGDDVASRATLTDEKEFVTWAETRRHGGQPLGALAATADLSEDQRKAAVEILGSLSRVVVLQGDAGTGKTRSLRAIVAGIEASGASVFGCAPSSGAAEVLRRELTPEADTLQQLLVNPTLQQKVRGRVLVVDEAGMISVRQMRNLCRIAEAQSCRLLLVGDTKQHASVEAGDALRCLQAYGRVPVARLSEIRRQKDPKYRAAVSLLARGRVSEAFTRLEKLGAVREERDQSQLFRTAAADYVQTITAGKTCLAIAPVWSDIHTFTAEVRAQLKRTGVLQGETRIRDTVCSFRWTREQCRRAENYQPGDVLAFHRASGRFAKGEMATVVRVEGGSLIVRASDGGEQRLKPRSTGGFDVGLLRPLEIAAGDRLLVCANHKGNGLRNGDLVEVAGFASDGALRLKDGRTVPADFPHLTHGYATTSHRSQGKTVNRGIVLMADASLLAANLKQAYVSNSRFEDSQAIYTTDRREALAAMGRPANRRFALEVFGPQFSAAASFRRALLHRIARSPLRQAAIHAMRGWRDTLARASEKFRPLKSAPHR